MKAVVVFALAMVPLVGCGQGFYSDGRFAFYEVVAARSEECAIRANGEFCVAPEQFDPPITQVWTVDINDDTSTLYVDEEVWVLAPLPDGSDPQTTARTASRRSIVTDGGSGCTTSKHSDISFTFDDVSLSGTMRASSVLEGPASCGDTPAGQRTVDTLTGSIGGP